MHIIILLVVFLLIWYFLSTKKNRPNAQLKNTDSNNHKSSAEISSFSEKIAFISKGKLFYRSIEGEILQVHSQYVQEMIDRVERKKQLHGWKDGTAFGTSFTGQTQQPISDQIKIQVISAEFIAPDKLVYFLQDDSFGGLFEYDITSKNEKRLLHKQNLNYQDLTLDSDRNNILCSQFSASGVANITKLNANGSESREITGGDTVDSAPAWVPHRPNQILFQTSGLARNSDGFIIAYGPASIQLLDMETGELKPVLESEEYDYMHPRVCGNGELYFIRRPYEMPKYSSNSFVADFFLFPFRLLRAIFHYLNFFSLMYSRKPLTSASGPQVKADLKDIILKGKRIDAENALRKESPVNGVPSLVPKNWELVRKSPGGVEQVMASNVASFNITSTDKIIYSNGFGVFSLTQEHGSNIIFKDKLIADVIVN